MSPLYHITRCFALTLFRLKLKLLNTVKCQVSKLHFNRVESVFAFTEASNFGSR